VNRDPAPRQLHLVTPDEQPAPARDQHSAAIVNEAVDALAALRTPFWLGDTAVHLHALASLIIHAQTLLPQAVAAARDQGHTWAEIGQLLNLNPDTAARRYRPTQRST
jgi:hypothetical protein